MSNLVVEVCEVVGIEPHPQADRMKIAVVKGWRVCVRFDPATGAAEFAPGDKCVYFPPDSILPPELAGGPDDNPPGRLNIVKYLKKGNRVAAARLRGFPSFGVILKLDPQRDPDWPVGTDVASHFGITKYEPPPETNEGDSLPDEPLFPRFDGPEHLANYPGAFAEGEDVVITEKIHGKNCRVGIVLKPDEKGEPVWTFMAGSHDVIRREQMQKHRRFKKSELVKKLVFAADTILEPGMIFHHGSSHWKITETEASGDGMTLRAGACTREGEPVCALSDFWMPLTPEVRTFLHAMTAHRPVSLPHLQEIRSVMLYGELYGSGVQDMAYGLANGEKRFIAFGLALNGEHVSHDEKTELFTKHGITAAPLLYRGPFRAGLVESLTDGPTTLSTPEKIAGRFKGREGVVIIPAVERLCPLIAKRCCYKSVSADYLARDDGTEFH